MIKHLLLTAFLCCCIPRVMAQYIPIGFSSELRYREQITGLGKKKHTSIKPYYISGKEQLTPVFPVDSNAGWLKRKILYEHLVEVSDTDYTFSLDFLPDFYIGKDIVYKRTIWNNTRGARAEAAFKNGFTFSTEFYENQTVFPEYLDTLTRRQRAVPGAGNTKYIDSTGFDYGYILGHISYQGKYFNFSLGNDKNFIGDGYRSLLLSDVSFAYPYFRITADVGSIRYIVLYTQMMYPGTGPYVGDVGYQKKYGVFHYLDWNVTKRLSLGLFESLIWQNTDTNGRKGYEWSYVNPVIFLRPAESSVGSPDNALMGGNIRFRLTPNSAVYGQLALDELNVEEMKANKGWWGNKFAIQFGYKSFRFLNVDGLFVLSEWNMAKPYTYSFRTPSKNYGHYNEPLAHPLGANFAESVSLVDYRYKRWNVSAQFNYARYGADSVGGTNNVGQDIFKSYITRDQEYGNKLLQGQPVTLTYAQLKVAYIINPKLNLRLEAGVTQRNERFDGKTDNTTIFLVGLRSSFRNFYYDR